MMLTIYWKLQTKATFNIGKRYLDKSFANRFYLLRLRGFGSEPGECHKNFYVRPQSCAIMSLRNIAI